MSNETVLYPKADEVIKLYLSGNWVIISKTDQYNPLTPDLRGWEITCNGNVTVHQDGI